jgi:outer membrane protein TolC
MTSIKSKLILLAVAAVLWLDLNGQDLSLQDCYHAARNFSPVKKQQPNIAQISSLVMESLKKEKLPQIFANGQYTYQSDVVSFPDFPGINRPDIPKNQYRISLDINQSLFAGNRINKMVETEKARLQVDQQELEVKLSGIKSSVNELFFAALSLQEKEKLYDIIIGDLKTRISLIQSLIRNGVLLPGNEKSLLIEIKRAEQEKTGLYFQKSGVLRMLEEKTGLEISSERNLVVPEFQFVQSNNLKREEKLLFKYSHATLQEQMQLTNLSRYPKLSAFGSLGIGNPNPVNFFETGTSEFYLVGLKLSWNIWDWNNSKRAKQILQLQQQNLNEEERDFDLNVFTQLAGASTNLEKLRNLLISDKEILELQKEITEEAFSRFREGVITPSEYSTELNRQIQAQLKLKMREIEISQAIVNILTLTGHI